VSALRLRGGFGGVRTTVHSVQYRENDLNSIGAATTLISF